MSERNLSSELEQLYQVLKQIDEGQDIFSPDGYEIEDLKKFQSTARCLQEAERRGYIGKIDPRESFMNDGRAGMVLDVNIIKGLTFKGHEILNNPKKLLIDNNPQAKIDMSTTINDSRHQSFNGTSTNSNINFGDNSTVTNTVQNSQADNEIKQLLTDLLKQISELNNKVPAEKIQVVENMSRDAKSLVEEINSNQPRKRNALFSLDGMKEAAVQLGETAAPIMAIAEKISPFLQTFI